jgi:integrase
MPKPTEYRAKDGTRSWRVRFRHAGKETSETFATQRAAEIFCDDIANRGAAYAVAMREANDRSRRGKTLDEALDAYLEWKAARVRSDRTIKDYRRRYELAIKPMLGHRPLAGITDEDVAEWVDAMVTGKTGRKSKDDRPLSAKSIADRHALLHSVIKHAVTKKWIDADPCATTDLPKRHKKAPKGLRPGEWQALHAALAQIDPDAADLAAFLLATGWRFGEATALTTYDVEDDGEDMWVSVTQVMRRDATGRTHPVEDAKSEAGQRRVKIDRETAGMVRERVRRARPGEFVFTTKNGAPWHHSHFRSRAWEPSVDLANLARRPTPHWLRHTHVGWMIMTKQANLPELQSRLGHASFKTTVDVYGRMVTDVSDNALDAFAAMRGATPTIVQPPPTITIEQ